MAVLETPRGILTLVRFPQQARETLRAWDAADEYLLQQLSDQQLPKPNSRLLLINDSFGALCCALADNQPTHWSDSHLAHQGALANLARNNIDRERITCLQSTSTPEGDFDLVIIKVPKTLALLEDQLCRLRPLLAPDTVIIGAGMVKQIHTSTLKLFEKIIGPTTTSLAKMKARLIFAQPDPCLNPGKSPYPQRYRLEGTDYQISNHANVFSREKLDIGTRFFLEHLPAVNARRIIDLGCGNGVVGLIAAERNPEADLTFIDESFMAVESARENFCHAFGDARHARFIAGDCLSDVAHNQFDLILNNPPFHQQNVVGDHIAWQMFKSSAQALTKGGQLWVVGNRHLGYHVKLKRLFGNCETVAGNKKFVILKALKQ